MLRGYIYAKTGHREKAMEYWKEFDQGAMSYIVDDSIMDDIFDVTLNDVLDLLRFE